MGYLDAESCTSDSAFPIRRDKRYEFLVEGDRGIRMHVLDVHFGPRPFLFSVCRVSTVRSLCIRTMAQLQARRRAHAGPRSAARSPQSQVLNDFDLRILIRAVMQRRWVATGAQRCAPGGDRRSWATHLVSKPRGLSGNSYYNGLVLCTTTRIYGTVPR